MQVLPQYEVSAVEKNSWLTAHTPGLSIMHKDVMLYDPKLFPSNIFPCKSFLLSQVLQVQVMVEILHG